MCVSKRVSAGCVCHLSKIAGCVCHRSKISSVNATYKIFKYSFLFLLWSCSRLLVSKRKQKKWTKWCSNWWEACSHSNGNKFRFGYIVCMAQVIINTMQQLNVKTSLWNSVTKLCIERGCFIPQTKIVKMMCHPWKHSHETPHWDWPKELYRSCLPVEDCDISRFIFFRDYSDDPLWITLLYEDSFLIEFCMFKSFLGSHMQLGSRHTLWVWAEWSWTS